MTNSSPRLGVSKNFPVETVEMKLQSSTELTDCMQSHLQYFYLFMTVTCPRSCGW